MKIIFLDYDGVLNNIFYLKNRGGDNFRHGIDDFDSGKVNILKRICDKTGAGVVIISSWRQNKIAIEFLKSRGIKVYGVAEDTGCRGEDIDRYLQMNDVEKYLILDDESSEYSQEQTKHLIYTRESFSTELLSQFDCLEGLQDKHIGWAESILS